MLHIVHWEVVSQSPWQYMDLPTKISSRCFLWPGSGTAHQLSGRCGIGGSPHPTAARAVLDRGEEPDEFYIKENIDRELEQYPKGKLFITQGFICRNAFGEIDNLKRGGSDYTASLIGAAVKADEVQIWTDIDGFHNNDPRYVEKTQVIRKLSFDEAAELAYFGAKILHPSSVRPCKDLGIPVRLKNTMNSEDEGTIISSSDTSILHIKTKVF